VAIRRVDPARTAALVLGSAAVVFGAIAAIALETASD